MIEIYDTTLRDGTQRTDVSLSCNDKLAIAHRLDDLGVAFIEGGWPGSNPKDVEFFQRAQHETWHTAIITSFGATCQANKQPAEDANIQALVDSGTRICVIFGKTSVFHVTEILRTTRENNLRMIEQSVAYLRSQGRRVFYDAEHFFDGYKLDAGYAVETLRAALRGGAEIVVLCDTNGGTMPWEVTDIVHSVKSQVDAPVGIHAHNDGECGVANTLAAVREGCVHVQGTINGYGERCGNANLCSVLPDLELKLGLKCLPDGNLEKMFEVSHYVSEMANLSQDEHLAYVGRAAFAHKGGVHVSAIHRNIHSYQHIDPALVGNELQVVVSELSGKSNLVHKIQEYGLELGEDIDISSILRDVKTLESRGFSFEAADASIVMMLKRHQKNYKAPFQLIDFNVMVEHRQGRGIFSEATVKVSINDQVHHTAADGNGPVAALDLALRKALITQYPQIAKFHLSDYKVRILDTDKGTSATTRVLIETRNGNHTWSTVGAGANIIEASWLALADSVEFGLMIVKPD